MIRAKLPAFLCAAAALWLPAAAETPPPPAPKAPFTQKAGAPAELRSFKPEIQGNAIICGGKRLEISPNGRMTLFAEGRETAKIYCYAGVKDSKTGAMDWFPSGDKRYYDNGKSTLKTEDGAFVYKGVFSADGKEGTLEQTVKITGDGKISVTAKLTAPETEDKVFHDNSYFFDFPPETAHNGKIEIDGQMLQVTESVKYGFINKPCPCDIKILAGDAQKNFEVSVPVSGRVIGLPQKDGAFSLRIYEPLGGKPGTVFEWAFTLDLTKGPETKTSSNARAGIDFKAADDLSIPDYKASKNLVQNPSFERGLECYAAWHTGGYSGPEAWKLEPFTIAGEEGVFGSRCMRLLAPKKNEKDGDYRRVGGWEGSKIVSGQLHTFPIPLETGGHTFSFYAKGQEGKKQRVCVWFPDSYWSGKYGSWAAIPGAWKIFDVSPEWKRYSLSFDVPVSLPTRIVMGADTQGANGHVLIDALQLETGGKATDFAAPPAEGALLTSKEDNFLQPSDKIDARLEIVSKPDSSGKVSVTVKNFFGEKVFGETFDFRCGKDGRALVRLPFDGKFGRGIFVVKVDYELADGLRAFDFHRFSVMDFLEGKHRLKNIFAEDYSEPEGRYDFIKMLDRFKKVGIGSKTHIHNWDKILWDTYRAHGVEPFNSFLATWFKDSSGKIDGFGLRNPWAGGAGGVPESNDPKVLLRDYYHDGPGEPGDAWLEKFQKATAEIVRQYPWIPLWAFGGEVLAKKRPEWWSKDGSEENGYKNYTKVLKAFYLGVREGSPNAKIFQDDPCNMSPEGGIAETDRLLAGLNKLGGVKFDMIGIHPYRLSPESPDLDADAQAFFKVLDKNGYAGTPVFWPEGMHYGPYTIPLWGIISASWGPPNCWYYGALSYDMGWTEKVSAAWRARTWLVALKYQDRVTAVLSSAFMNNFEMDLNMTPFATQKISNTLGRLLGDAYFKKDIRFAPYVRAYIFEDAQKRPLAAVWCHHPRLDAGIMPPPEASVSLGGALEKIFDLMECERDSKADSNGAVRFPVTSFPLFFVGKPGTLESFVKAFDNAALVSGEGISPVTAGGKPSSPDKAAVTVKNWLSRPFDGTFECAGVSQKLSIPASGQAVLSQNLPLPMRYDKITQENLPVLIKSGDSSFSSDVSFEGFLCHKTKNDITVDGSLDDWKDIPEIKFENRAIADKNLKNIEDNDFSGWFKTAWNEKGVWICVKITDDKFVHEAFPKTAERWANDCLQIYFDSFCDARLKLDKGYDENDYDYTVFPNPDGKSSVVWRYRTPDIQLGLATQAPPDNTEAKDIPSAFKLTGDGYIYEVFFPAKYLLPIRLEKGYAAGFGLYAADCDDASAKTSKRVRSALTLTPPGTGCYNNPKLWPAMLLTD